MIRDAVIDEVRALRDEIAREFDYDIDAIFEALRNAEESNDREHVSLQPRRAVQQRAAADRASPGR